MPHRAAGVKREAVEPGFRAFVSRVYGEEGRAWIAGLPIVQEELAQRWRLELGPELPGGQLSSVRAVRLASGDEAVLKIGSRPRARDEIVALRTWAGRAAPELLAADEELNAMLLERIGPGSRARLPSEEAVADVLRGLHVPPPHGLLSLDEIVERRIEIALRDGRASEQKAGWALTKVAELRCDRAPSVLLHGDFVERHLLACSRRGLCAIDPLPCVGDPAYDAAYWVHGNRQPGRRARLDAIVEATGLDRRRVRDWAAIIGVHG